MGRIYITPEHNTNMHADIIRGLQAKLEPSCRTPQGRADFAAKRSVEHDGVRYNGRVQVIAQDVQFTITSEEPVKQASEAKATARKAAPKKAAVKKAAKKK